jgi:hypothetical protein
MTPIKSIERSRGYRPEGTCPKDRALVVVQDQRCLVLDHIGPSLDYLEDLGTLDTSLDKDLTTLVQGVYIWMGKLFQTSKGPEELRGQWRMASKDEWIRHLDGKSPWESRLWIYPETDADADDPEDSFDEEGSPMDATKNYTAVSQPQNPIEVIKSSVSPPKQPVFRLINWKKSPQIEEELVKKGWSDGQTIDVDAKVISQLALKYDLLISTEGDTTLIYLDKKEGHFKKCLTPRVYKAKVETDPLDPSNATPKKPSKRASTKVNASGQACSMTDPQRLE